MADHGTEQCEGSENQLMQHRTSKGLWMQACLGPPADVSCMENIGNAVDASAVLAVW